MYTELVMKVTKLERMFKPRSVAVVGASREKKKLGHIILKNIIDSGFEGEVLPINPGAQTILSHKCFASYAELPIVPELAVIAVPAPLVIGIMRQIGQKGTTNVVIITAGFKEVGGDGVRMEKELLDVAEEYGMNILGPNCLGFVNNFTPINATFGRIVDSEGSLRFISQSGAIASSIFDWAESTGLGFDTFVTLGNKAQLGENDVISYWLKDDLSSRTFDASKNRAKGLSSYQPVGMYLESIQNGEEFLKLCTQMSVHSPMFVLKPGKSAGAAAAMQSHTGSIAGSDAVFEQAMKEAGVIRCEGVEDMFDLCRVFSWEDAPAGPNVAVVSNAGGPAVIAADFVELEGLKLSAISKKAKDVMSESLPLAASLHNPIDVLGDALAMRYERAMDAVLEDKDVQAMIVILTPQVMTEIEETARAVVKMSKSHQKPIVCAFMGGSAIEEGERVLNKYKIPSFRFPERAIWALSKMWKWNEWRKMTRMSKPNRVARSAGMEAKDKARQLMSDVLGENRKVMTSEESQKMLELWGIEVPGYATVEDYGQAVHFAHEHDWPVVLKISSPQLLHKIEEGGVVLNLRNEEQLKGAFEAMHDSVIVRRANGDEAARILVQEQVSQGLEVIIGIRRDPQWGCVMMFGAGGTWAEVIADRNLRLLPVDLDEAEALVKNSKIYRLLAGYRNDKPYDLANLCKLMVRMSEMMEEHEEITDLEINPVIVQHKGVWAVDGKVMMG